MTTLHNHHDIAERSHKAIPYREPPLLSSRACWGFRNDGAKFTDPFPKASMPTRVGLIDAAGHDGDWRGARSAGTLVSRAIDAQRET